MASLDRRLTDLERKAQPPEPVTIRLVHAGETVDDDSEVIRLSWGDTAADDITIHCVDLTEEGDPARPATPSGPRAVDYRRGLHQVAPLEGGDDARD